MIAGVKFMPSPSYSSGISFGDQFESPRVQALPPTLSHTGIYIVLTAIYLPDMSAAPNSNKVASQLLFNIFTEEMRLERHSSISRYREDNSVYVRLPS
jgi:hypothetical protein